jgi:histidinol phosphatase-like enzyme (inositol monophosphatase family)
MQPTLDNLLAVAQDAAYRAGQRTLAYFKTGVAADRKADNTPVTIADREAERLLRETILSAFPDHAILGEEEGETTGTAPYRWILDPIDGTKAFVAGVPTYGTLIGVEREGEIVAGVIYLPAQGDMVAAAQGKGCSWNGRPCRVSAVTDLKDATVVCSSIVRSQQRSGAFARLTEATYLQRTWGDAFGYALVATGRVEVMLDPVLSPWDVGPMPVIMKEAGGRFSSWSGENSIYRPDGFATSDALYPHVLEILRAG